MKPGFEVSCVCFSCQNEFKVGLVASLGAKEGKVTSCPFCKSNQVTFATPYSQQDATAKQVQELQEQLTKLKARNLVNAVKRICEVCGHNKTEDGCPHCLQSKYATERETFVGIAKLFKIDVEQESPQETYEQFQQLEQSSRDDKALIEKLVEALKNNQITVSSTGASHVCVGCGEPFQYPHKDYCLIDKALSLAHSKGYGKKG